MAFAGVHEGMVGRLAPLFRQHGAKATYLLSPELMKDAACVEALTKLAREAELGTHLHGEYAEPYALDAETTLAFQRDYPPELERQKLTSLTTLFRDAFGAQPLSFRAGRFGIAERSLGYLEALGYRVDSSVTPHVDWRTKGVSGLDFRGAPTQPYRPSHDDIRREGERALWEVPVTIAPHRLSRMPIVGRRLEARWLRPTRVSARNLIALARHEIRSARQRRKGSNDAPVVLNVMFHNVEIVEGKSPYASNLAAANGILGRLGALLAFARREGIRSIGLADVPDLFA